jgi:hypothetical protein
MDRYERLTNLLKTLKKSDRNESNSRIILRELLSEINIESLRNEESGENKYLKDLKKTLDDQAEDYKNRKNKKPHSSHEYEFRGFMRNFIQDVEDELMRLRIK